MSAVESGDGNDSNNRHRWVEKKDWAQALFIAVKEAGPFKVDPFDFHILFDSQFKILLSALE